MFQFTLALIDRLHAKQAPASAIGLFRLLYGLVTLQEVLFLLYFNHLIFDPIPYIDVEFPTIPFFLGLWALVAGCVALGYRYRPALLANYLFWIVFVNFTPMQRDFDGGFDMFMTGANFFLLFMPGDRAFALDDLRRKLSTPFRDYRSYPTPTVSALAYYLPVAICLGFLYFDSVVHKMFAEHWRNGLGSWLPSTQPFYVSALDMSWLLNQEYLVKAIGYTIIVFQFTFLFFFNRRCLRPVYLFIGIGMHLGITLSLNIYPFGMGMLIFYVLLVPFAWQRKLGNLMAAEQPRLTVFFDQLCPLCNRTVLVINHFDLFHCIDFKGAQDHAARYPALSDLSQDVLLTDLYALDRRGQRYAGLDTYIRILIEMRYLSPLGWLLKLPGIYHLAARKYRRIADNRTRLTCDADCVRSAPLPDRTYYHLIFEQYAARKPKAFARKLAKILIAIALLQLNSTVHFGLLYRLHWDKPENPALAELINASNQLISLSQLFIGIAPHALYLHDHFAGYDRIIGITYTDAQGREQWLPFVNEQGRLLAPNWGRVHSMWANIAVTPTINDARLKKFVMKVTAFWGRQLGLPLDRTVFHLQMKKIAAPNEWVEDLLHKNFAGEWRQIGTATWRGGAIDIEMPGNINDI